MNIMYIVFSFTMGGTERLLIDQCNEMCKRGNSVFVCIINNYYDEELLSLFDSRINIYKLERKPGSRLYIRYLIKIAMLAIKSRIQIIHGNGMNTVEAALIVKILNPKIKLYWTVHDTIGITDLTKVRLKILSFFTYKIIAVSKCVKNIIIDCGIDSSQVDIIYNGINWNKFVPLKVSKDNPGMIRIGNVARITPIKAQDVLIDALGEVVKSHSNIVCEIAGAAAPDDRAVLETLKDRAAMLNIADKVIFKGSINDINEFYNSIDIFVIPSLKEGFGLAVLEAMAMEIPCILNSVEGPKEIVDITGTGILYDGTSLGLAEKLNMIIDNLSYYKQLSKIKAPIIRRMFSVEEMCERLEFCYDYVHKKK